MPSPPEVDSKPEAVIIEKKKEAVQPVKDQQVEAIRNRKLSQLKGKQRKQQQRSCTT